MEFEGTSLRVSNTNVSDSISRDLQNTLVQLFDLEISINNSLKTVRFLVSNQVLFEDALEKLTSNADDVIQVSNLPLDCEGLIDEAKLIEFYRSSQKCSLESKNRVISDLEQQTGYDHSDSAPHILLGERSISIDNIHIDELIVKNIPIPEINSSTSKCKLHQVNGNELPLFSDNTSNKIQKNNTVPDSAIKTSEVHNSNSETESLPPHNLIELLEIRAGQQESPELVFLSNNSEATETINCKDLHQAAKKLAQNLIINKVSNNPYVIIHVKNLKNTLVTFWGCLFAHCIPVITTTWVSAQPTEKDFEKIDGVWKHLNNAQIIVDESTGDFLKNNCNSDFARSDLLDINYLLNAPSEEIPTLLSFTKCNAEDIAFLNLTSGSTGVPKCVALTHSNILARSKGTIELWKNSPNDVTLNWLPFDHIGSISDWHIRCLVLGCKSIYAPTDLVLANPINWLDLINQHRVTHTWATDTAYKSIINTIKKSTEEYDWDLSCVNTFLNAAEPIAESTARDLTAVLKPYSLRTNCIVPAFGMAELGSGINYSRAPEGEFKKQLPIDRDSLANHTLKIVKKGTQNSVSFTSLGPVIPGMSMRIVDSEFNVLSELSVGQLQVKGSSLSNGYLNNDEANNALISSDGWFNTGDKGFIYESELYLSGRTKDTLIINGKNFSPLDFEGIVDALPGVLTGYSAAIQTKGTDGSSENLVVFFCPEKEDLNDQELTQLLKTVNDAISSSYQLTPDYLIPETSKNIPKTSIQKIQRSQLVKRVEAGNYQETCKKIDLLTGSERTVKNWFARYDWTLDYGCADYYQSADNLLILVSDLTPEICRFLTIESASAKTILIIADKRLQDSATWPQSIPSEQIFYIEEEDPEKSHSEYYLDLRNGLYDYMDETPFSIVDFRLFSFNDKQALSFETIIIDCNPLIATLIAEGKIISNVIGYTLVGSNTLIDSALFWSISVYYRTLVYDYISRNLTTENRSDTLSPPTTKAVYFDFSLENKLVDFSEKLKTEITRKSPIQEVRYRFDQPYSDNSNQNVQTINSANNIIVRETKRLENVVFDSSSARIDQLQANSWVLVTGGLGGIGFEVCQWLQKRHINLVVLGSKDEQHFIIENRTQYERLQSLKKDGNVIYKNHKINNADDLNTEIQHYQSEINTQFSAVFHLAGVIADDDSQYIKNSHLESVWRTKVEGAKAINQLVADQPNTLVVYFSSVMASNHKLGSPAYSAANAYIEQLAKMQQDDGRPVYTIAWSAWKGVGLSKDLPVDIIKKQGLEVLTKRAALTSLEGILSRAPTNISVGINSNSINFQTSKSQGIDTLHKILCIKKSRERSENDTNSIEKIEPIIHSSHAYASMLVVDEIPCDDNNNVDYSALRKLFTVSSTKRIEPRNDLEQQIASIWESVLGHNDFGINDSFYTVGGNSMLTTTMHTTMLKLWHIELSLGDIYEHTTILKQSELISTRLQEYSTSVTTATESADNRKDRVLCLQKETENTPIFCLCGIELYAELAKAFKDIAPVYAIYLNMEEEAIKDDRLLNVYEMASAYLAKIKETQPSGPYRLMGLSFGAAIAFEVAQQLTTAGDKVELLGVLDFNLPVDLKSNRVISDMKFMIKDGIRMTRRKILSALSSVNSSFKLKPEIIEVHYTRAFHPYKKSMKQWPHPENTIIFRAEHEPSHKGQRLDINGGWNQLMTDPEAPLEAHLIEGNHLGILKDNGPHQIAALVKDKLALLN